MKKLLVRLAISVIIGAAMLYLAAREISFAGMGQALAEARWWVLWPFFAVMAVQHLFRAWRWGFLLAPIDTVPLSRLLPVSSVGFFAILALPLRMGEFVRPYLIADPPRLRMSHGLGTMAVERVFDGLILSLTAFAAIAVARSKPEAHVPGWLQAAGLIALAVFCVALVVLVMTLWQRDRAVTLCSRLVGLVSPRLAVRAAGIARGVVDGFRVLPDLRRLLPFIGATLCYWLGNAAAVWVLGIGFELHLTLSAAIGLIAIVGIGIMIPAGPGFIGNFELFAEGALALYTTPQWRAQRGAAFIVAMHATNALWYIGAGLVGLMSPHVTIRRVWTISTGDTPDPDPGAAVVTPGATASDTPSGQKLDVPPEADDHSPVS